MTRHAAPVVLALALGGCAVATRSELPGPPQTPLERRQAQTRAFDTADARLVLKAAVNVLQDEGFVIQQAESELGIVTAVSEWHSVRGDRGLRILKWVAALPTYGTSLLLHTGRDELSAVEVVVNVSPEAERTRVRITMVAKVRDGKGNVCSVRPVDDPLAYQRIFAGLDKAVFLEKEGL
jgi:hypothetical protein